MSIEQIRRLKWQSNEPKPRKFYSIPKVSEKRAAKIKEQNEIFKLDTEFYMELWRKRDHRCFECGKSLGHTFKRWFAHHILEKSKYENLRHTPENLIFLCLIHHDQVRIDIDRVPKVKKLTEETEKLLLKE